MKAECNCSAKENYVGAVLHHPACNVFKESEDMSIKLFKNLPPPTPTPPPTYSLEGMSYEQKQMLANRLVNVINTIQAEINALPGASTLALTRLNGERQFFSRVLGVLRGNPEERQREIGKK